MSTSHSSKPTYTNDQINQFYNRISLPQKYRLDPSSTTDLHATRDGGSLKHLHALVRHTLATVPFENLSLHYSPTPAVSLNPDHLFHKVVTSNTNRGGYCMELNYLFSTVLRTLGYTVTTLGARVNGSAPGSIPSFSGWSHMVNLVTINGTKYFVDVGFGDGGPSHPIALDDGKEVVNIAPSTMARVRYAPIPEHADQSQRLWIFEIRKGDREYWPRYCFSETEFTGKDYAVMNLATSMSRTSWFTYQVVCVLWLLSEDGDEIIGDLTLFERVLKRKIGDKSEVVVEVKSEEERVKVLKEYFGIKLSDAERNGIKGMVSAITG